jgi:ribosomal protein S18 acetylase RimI-like enzyme
MNHETIAIHPCRHFDPQRFAVIAGGYTTKAYYQVNRTESDEETSLFMKLVHLENPQEFAFPYSDEELDRYSNLVREGYCWGAYEGELLVAIALAEPHWWNKTLWVWEFHVAPTHQRQGIGRRLIGLLRTQAGDSGLRALVCETQNTNVNAIRFYRSVGFTVDGIDVSYYTNEDMLPGRTVAIFMKLKLV